MIVFNRIDHRLIHGQVAYALLNYVGADCILIPNDNLVNDKFKKTALKLAKPAECKLVIKTIEDAAVALNSGVTDKYKLSIIFETVEDLYRLCQLTDCIKEVNFGLSNMKENAKSISKAVYIDEKEEKMLKELMNRGIKIYLQQGPRDSSKDLSQVI